MYKDLPIDQCHPSPTNPRKRFNQVKLQELADSIKEHEVMQPIVVRPMPGLFEAYEIVAGERRWRGSRLATKPTIPAMVRKLTDLQVLQLQVIENSQRDDLHPLEEAKGFKYILDNQDAANWNADQLAEKVGKSRTYIYNTLKLNELCVYSQDMFLDDRFGREVALLIARIPGEKLQTEATKEIITPDWQGQTKSFREVQRILREKYTLKLASAPFKITDETLVPFAGSCKTCPHKSGNCTQDYPDIESADVCTNTECFSAKKAAHIEQLKELGAKVIDGAAARKILPGGWDLHQDYVRIGDNCPGKSESIQKALGGNNDCVITLVKTDGELIQVAKKSDVQEALQEKGINVTFTNTRSYTEDEKEKERQFKIENAYRRQLMHEVSQSLKANLEVDHAYEGFEETIIARSMLNDLDHESGKRLLRILGIPFTTDEGPYKAKQQLLDSIPNMTTPERMVLILQLALIGEIHANEYSSKDPANINQVADHYGIDREAIRKSTLEEFAPKTKVAKNPKTSPTPLPAAQAQEIKGEDQAELIETPAGDPGQDTQTSEEDIAPGALPDVLPAVTAVDPSPAAQASESNTAEAPLSNFDKIRLAEEARRKRRAQRQAQKVSGQPDAESGADQAASANHTH
jgi:ParB/RepB/Spo0J family partition protein